MAPTAGEARAVNVLEAALNVRDNIVKFSKYDFNTILQSVFRRKRATWLMVLIFPPPGSQLRVQYRYNESNLAVIHEPNPVTKPKTTTNEIIA
jgi:hypothetical protein